VHHLENLLFQIKGAGGRAEVSDAMTIKWINNLSYKRMGVDADENF
jgi:hypothetical protein